MTIYYRLVIGLLLIFVLIAYIDTKSLKETLDDSKLLREYKNTTKLIGIGIHEAENGVEVKDVVNNTPAQKSGVEIGDIVVDIDGQKVKSAEGLRDYLKDVKKNKKIALTIQKPDNTIVKVSLMPTTINNYR